MGHARFISIILVMAGLLACTPGRKSASGFHLPDGNVEQGKAAFVALKCTDCHQVAGVADIPAPTLSPSVVLGGLVAYPKTDGKLVSMIIDPSERIGAGSSTKDRVQIGMIAHMAERSSAMTIKQLVDVVAFLQSHYKVRSLPVARDRF